MTNKNKKFYMGLTVCVLIFILLIVVLVCSSALGIISESSNIYKILISCASKLVVVCSGTICMTVIVVKFFESTKSEKSSSKFDDEMIKTILKQSTRENDTAIEVTTTNKREG